MAKHQPYIPPDALRRIQDAATRMGLKCRPAEWARTISVQFPDPNIAFDLKTKVIMQFTSEQVDDGDEEDRVINRKLHATIYVTKTRNTNAGVSVEHLHFEAAREERLSQNISTLAHESEGMAETCINMETLLYNINHPQH